MIDFNHLNGERRDETKVLLHEACEKWGFFMVNRMIFLLPISSVSVNKKNVWL